MWGVSLMLEFIFVLLFLASLFTHFECITTGNPKQRLVCIGSLVMAGSVLLPWASSAAGVQFPLLDQAQMIGHFSWAAKLNKYFMDDSWRMAYIPHQVRFLYWGWCQFYPNSAEGPIFELEYPLSLICVAFLLLVFELLSDFVLIVYKPFFMVLECGLWIAWILIAWLNNLQFKFGFFVFAFGLIITLIGCLFFSCPFVDRPTSTARQYPTRTEKHHRYLTP